MVGSPMYTQQIHSLLNVFEQVGLRHDFQYGSYIKKTGVKG